MRYRISKYKHLHSNRFRYLNSSIPLICASGLVVVLSLMLSGGFVYDVVLADSEEDSTVENEIAAINNEDDGIMLLADGVSLTVGSTSLSGTAASVSEIVSATTDLTVSSSGVYNIYVQETGNDGNLVGQNGKEKIQAMQTSAAYSAIPAGRWGYAIAEGSGKTASSLTYQGVPTSTTASAFGGTSASDKAFTLAFAAKFGPTQSADHYKANVLVSVAANPGEVTTKLGFGGVTTMQDLTKSVCKGVSVGTEGMLRDTRDQKIYWVARLADNNCWMTQNLDYDGGGTLTAISSWPSSGSPTIYGDPGDYILTTSGKWSNCTSIKDGLYNSSCFTAGWRRIPQDFTNNSSGWVPTYNESFINATQFVGIDGQNICTKIAGDYFGDPNGTDSNCKIYYTGYEVLFEGLPGDYRHYYVGNYYSYLAATNGTGSSATSDGAIASGNICPNTATNTDWQLPLSHTNNNSRSGSFYNLLNKYSLASAPTSGNNSVTGGLLYFVPGGGVWSGNLNNAGNSGFYWSSTANGSAYAYILSFNSSAVNPSYNNSRYYGFSVRCLVQGS